MRQTIVIIGALPNDPRREDLLSILKIAASEVEWYWIHAHASSCRPEIKYVRQLQAKAARNLLCIATTSFP